MNKFMSNRFNSFGILLLCATMASAQEITPSLFNGLAWRLIGPFRGGRCVAVSGVPDDGSTFYFGAVDGGVWKTTDAGAVWKPLFDKQAVASIGALAVAPSDPNVIYAGTGESDIRSDLATGDGVYKSTDAGETWRHVGLPDTRQISRIVVSPVNAKLVYVAALGHAYAPNAERGVFKSSDGGASWRKVLYRGAELGAADLAIASDEPSVLFATLWNAHRPPWSTYAPVTGAGSGLFRSTDGGDTWQQISGHGLPEGDWGRAGVAIAPGTGGKRIYAAIDANKAGLYRSDDGGETWTRTNSDPRITSRAWYFNQITVDPNDPDVVYIPNVALYRLGDGGRTLSIVRGAPGGDDYHQLWIDPKNSRHMALATDQGTTISLDEGATWSSWYNQPTGQLYHVITDDAFPYHVYGAQQDSGSAVLPSRTDQNDVTNRDLHSIGGTEGGMIAPDPRNPDIVYSTDTFGVVSRFDRRTSQSQNIAPWPVSEFTTEMPQRKYRDPWTPVLLFSPLQTNALYLGTQYVMRTLDGGLHWQRISPDLTGAQPTSPRKATPAMVTNAKQLAYGVVYTIAPSPLRAMQLWAGTDTGLIHLTRDGGATWSAVTPPKLTPWSKVTQIEASHFSAGEAWAAIDRHRLDDMRPYLYRTRDFGKSWEAIADGICDRCFVNSVREDPKRRALLYAATEFGVYVSFNDGAHWEPLQLNLPITSVRDVVIHGNDLIAATHGRSFWILDDIAPLRQAKDDVAGADFWLYEPGRALRMTSDNFLGTPLPLEEPHAANPPRGAYIDYYLRHGTSYELLLEILDSAGKLVRRYSSDDKPVPPPKNVAIAPQWFPKPQELKRDAGMHRFIWDLRYGRTGDKSGDADSDSDSGDDGPWLGPLVMPGRYVARLTVNGRQLTRTFEVAMDPRSHATRAELSVQFQWAQRAFDAMIKARRAFLEQKGLHEEIGKAQAQIPASDQAGSAALMAADHETTELMAGGKDPDSAMQTLSKRLTAVLNALESADRTPPSQVIQLYRQASEALGPALRKWEDVKEKRLPRWNEQLQKSGISPIRISEIEEEAADSLAK